MKNDLPIGTILKLHKSNRLFMIIGYCKKMNLKKIDMLDYFVCKYPEGVIGLKKVIPIKRNEIESIIYEGKQYNK